MTASDLVIVSGGENGRRFRRPVVLRYAVAESTGQGQGEVVQIEWIQCQDHDEAKHHWRPTYLHERDGKPFHWGKLKIDEAQLRTESPVSPRAETQRASIYGDLKAVLEAEKGASSSTERGGTAGRHAHMYRLAHFYSAASV